MKNIDLADNKRNAMIQTESLYLDNFTAADLEEVLENINIMKKVNAAKSEKPQKISFLITLLSFTILV